VTPVGVVDGGDRARAIVIGFAGLQRGSQPIDDLPQMLIVHLELLRSGLGLAGSSSPEHRECRERPDFARVRCMICSRREPLVQNSADTAVAGRSIGGVRQNAAAWLMWIDVHYGRLIARSGHID
jgi:hypothetical protein